MPDTAILVEHLSKRYTLGNATAYGSLRESLSELAAATWRRIARSASQRERPATEFWALRDVCLEVRRGVVQGVIGANGAGKSTLLKVLSRVTYPTAGAVRLRGRVGTLLEVGTGFHPELTGRDNIYLSGAILGMSRQEIRRKFDDIVAFAEVERFIDTPVKRYSSGMYVRLAFAVAAHLEPEILLVDEVLAVGDASFQRKCLGKMQEVSGEGRTVLFVSHNMAAVKALCSQALWLDRGTVRQNGQAARVVDAYLADTINASAAGSFDADYLAARRSSNPKYIGDIKLATVSLTSDTAFGTGQVREGGRLTIHLDCMCSHRLNTLGAHVRVRTAEGTLLATCIPDALEREVLPGRVALCITVELGPLLPGRYMGDVVLLSRVPQDSVSPAFEFEVIPDPRDPEAARTVLFGATDTGAGFSAQGVLRMAARWI